MQPINNRFVVEVIEEDRTVGVLEIPKTLDGQTQVAKGIVKAIPEIFLSFKGTERECPLKINDKVLFTIYCQQTKEGDKVTYFPAEHEIFAIITED